MKWIILILLSNSVWAGDQWFCTEGSSKLIGNTLNTCGIGIASSEALARDEAFDRAAIEFLKLCDLDAGCDSKNARIEPKRTECEPIGNKIKCTRMLAFNMVNRGPSSSHSPYGKLYRGMPKAQVLKIFGMPFDVTEEYVTENFILLHYRGSLCKKDDECVIHIIRNKVSGYENVNPKYTDLLD